MLKLLDKDFNLIAEITNAYSATVDKEINSGNTLKFMLAQNDINAINIKEGNYVECDSQKYLIEDYRISRENTRTIIVNTVHVWFELEKEYWENDFEVVDTIEWEAKLKCIEFEFYTYLDSIYQCLETHNATSSFDSSKFRDVSNLKNNYQSSTTPQDLLTELLSDTQFQVGTCYSFEATDFTIERGDIMKNMKKIQELWGGEWLIDNYTVALVNTIGADNNVSFEYAKNNINVTKEVDIKEVITRLFVYGKDGLTLAEINNDKNYIDASAEIFSLYKRPRIGEISFDEEDEDRLLTKANEYLSKMQNAHITYSLTVAELKYLARLEQSEKFDLGDVIRIRDAELLGVEVVTRIMNYSYNPLKRDEASSVTLNNKQKTLVTIFNQIQEDVENTKTELTEKIEEIANQPKLMNSIVEVTQQQIINAETVHALNAWIKNLFVDYLETAFTDKDARNSVAPAERNFISIKEQDIKFITQDLDLTQTEDLLIPNPNSYVQGYVNVYYTAIGDHADAYKYFTTTAPSTIYKEIIQGSAEENAFKVKVYKSSVEKVKLKISFKEDTNEPIIVFGSGLPENEDYQTSGKGFIYKSENVNGDMGLEIDYYSKTGEIRKIELDDNGISTTSTNQNLAIRHILNGIIMDTLPDASVGQEGDICFVPRVV